MSRLIGFGGRRGRETKSEPPVSGVDRFDEHLQMLYQTVDDVVSVPSQVDVYTRVVEI